MKRLLIPLLLLIVGVSGGVGAGIVLAPAPPEPAATAEAGSPAAPSPCGDPAAEDPAADGDTVAEGDAGGPPTHEYVKLNNQFVVPLLTNGRVVSLVMLSLSVEVPAGHEEEVLGMEPKLRDVFLQVLFDHANTGGFDGVFTAASAMRTLRGALLQTAQAALGPVVTDVLITDIVRQDQ